MNATLLQRIPRSTMIAQTGRTKTPAELSQMLQNEVIIESAGRRTCVRLQSPVVQASRARRGLLVLVARIFSLSLNRWGAGRMRQSHKTDAPEHATAGAGSRLTLGDVPRDAAGRGGRLECALLAARGRLPHPGTRRHP